MAEITCVPVASLASNSYDTHVYVGTKANLQWLLEQNDALHASLSESSFLLSALSPSGLSADVQTTVRDSTPARVALVGITDVCSRNLSPSRSDQVTDGVRRAVPKKGTVRVVLVTSDSSYAPAYAVSFARAFSLFSRKTAPVSSLSLHVSAVSRSGEAVPCERLQVYMDCVRLAASMGDTPAADLTPSVFVAKAREVCGSLGSHVTVSVTQGDELDHKGFGGIWGVGKGAMNPPALCHLSYTPPEHSTAPVVVMVGKGITYDTGGLCIKPREGMCGMKGDMCGAAAVLGAFKILASANLPVRLHAVLCLAENAVGERSFRPDDILTLYSGLTVEINNTDAEGRLVLGDGVAFAAKHLQPNLILDIATLTGAQGITTGKKHAAILTNNEDLERVAVAAGKVSGDLVYPMLYCPELLKNEFASEVADMKNSVKDRMNAQASCAGHFIESHLCDYQGPWIHIDMASPSKTGERMQGYGVALLTQLVTAFVQSA
eukprot:GILI01009808.1.p1 GENE.GILI01009808.1~~GILI01009808.1.p1  ORF type:complete len:491 (+),score=151.09 GILI01009808.1:79-1551(+)